MTIDRVIYGSTVPTIQFGNQRPGFEASILPGEDPVEVYMKLHEIAIKCVEKTVPPILMDLGEPNNQTAPAPASFPLEINLQTERIEIAIDNASNAEQLKAVETQWPVMPLPVRLMYNKKMAELNNPNSFTSGLD